MRNVYQILVETNGDQSADIELTGKALFKWLGKIKGEDVE
jgi:hypothetical protein